MEVILLERVGKLGNMGEVVRVKNGFARNFLLPQNKALRATKENRERFEVMKGDLEVRNKELRGEAETAAKKVDGKSVIVIRQAGESGNLYGSVSPRDIANALGEAGASVNRTQIVLNTPIKTIGMYKVPVALHPEVEVTVSVIVARTADEAQRVQRGEDVTIRREEGDTEAVAEDAFFEPKAAEARHANEEEEDDSDDKK